MNLSLCSQMGRSMVEMLGVLSIMGVLSLGVLAGYSYAIDKYSANETTHDVNLRMTDLIVHLEQKPDMEPEDLTGMAQEWGEKGTIYPMEFVYDTKNGDIEYAVEVITVPKRVCRMVFDNLINQYIIEVGDKRYENQTDENICASFETMAFYLKPEMIGGTAQDMCGDSICSACQECDEGTKQCVPVPNATKICEDENNHQGWCEDGVCKLGNCLNCSEGQFCADKNIDCQNPYPDHCENLDFSIHEIAGIEYHVSNHVMSWWDSVSACQALGYSGIVGITDLLVDGVSGKKNALAEGLFDILGGQWIWTRDLSNNMTPPCYAWFVSLTAGVITGNSRFNTGLSGYAVCK